MCVQCVWLFAVLAGASLANQDLAQELKKNAELGIHSTIKSGDVSYALPFSVPTRDEVLRAFPEAEKDTFKDAQVNCELIVYHVDPIRDFPSLGRGRLVHVLFKCTVTKDGRSELVYMDRDHVVPAK